MITGFHHAGISTPDLDRAVAFYCDHLGFEVIQRQEWSKGSQVADDLHRLKDSAGRSALLRLAPRDNEENSRRAEVMVEFLEFESPEPAPPDPNRRVCESGIAHMCFLVDDCQADYERLVKAGMDFHCPPMGGGARAKLTYGRDPDGNIIELLERPKPSS